MYKIAVMGDKDSIYGFASIGLDIFPVYEPQVAIKTLRRIVDGGYAVIYITAYPPSTILLKVLIAT